MKRFAIATLAALTFAAPLASTAAYADPPRHNDNRGDNNRNDNNRRDNDRRDSDRRDNDRRDNDRRGDRWDGQRHSQYQQGRWNANYQHRGWRRGERLPSNYHARYRAVDYRREHLRAPPRGYQYVRDDRNNSNETLLVALATGAIIGVILANQ
jgi:Ni/Co efflux regulator RcnB